jgi:hypothetical protein
LRILDSFNYYFILQQKSKFSSLFYGKKKQY